MSKKELIANRQYTAEFKVEAVRLGESMAILLEWLRYRPFDPEAKNRTAVWGKPHYVAYVLTHESDPVAIEIGEAQPIGSLVRDFRVALSDPKHTDVKELAEELSEKLVKP